MSALLSIQGLEKRFGGVTATDSLTLDIMPGELHAIIGPNGAGKTTLIGQLSGEIAPDAGSIRFKGADITGLPVERRALLGLARSFQITSVLQGFTALENVLLAAQAHDGHSFRFWKPVLAETTLRDTAMAVLDQVGLAGRAAVPAAALAHGEQRQLELAMALAGKPDLLLLDEPMAGMGPEESVRMTELLAGLKGSVTILLVEHDMDAVFRLADRITVLVYGSAIATGTPDAIRADESVRAAYLGSDS
ncbi:branched-chain amino acid transport system ATP-binding protein [Oceanibaculum indicum]|uniref:Branched-chain amino acid transport system ATP-binding protein n=1 Tax=Oceanibaculum indicum TaxID=526216 RepID=A0A420WQL2_9PROT|nr:ABC transporter ATP-binding protein [Oceanibaculum indicum]RKQ73323.1 branched-chain amino acid transport system ATP-binding protein [Oceanibaculum indicum]